MVWMLFERRVHGANSGSCTVRGNCGNFYRTHATSKEARVRTKGKSLKKKKKTQTVAVTES